MIYQNEKNIILSELFTEESIAQLVKQYEMPFEGFSYIRQPLQPRRMIGRYLTYLDETESKPVSIMVNMLKDHPTISCDCSEFTKNGQCIHVARVIYSIKDALKKEQEAKSITLAREKALKVKKANEAANTYDNLLIDNAEIANFKATELPKINQEDLENYTIPNAAEFEYMRVNNILNKFARPYFNNKPFKTGKKVKNGFDLLFQYLTLSYSVQYRINEDDDLLITCDCGKTNSNVLCEHALAATQYLINARDRSVFSPYLSRIKEKNTLLADYGLTLEDPEAQNFEFKTDYNNKLILVKAPKQFANSRIISKFGETFNNISLYNPSNFKSGNYKIGLLLQLNTDEEINFPIKIGVYTIEYDNKNSEKLTKINIDLEENINKISILSPEDFDVLMQFSYLKYKNKIFNNHYNNSYSQLNSFFESEKQATYLDYFFDKLEAHWRFFTAYPEINILYNKKFAKSNLKPVKFEPVTLNAYLVIEYTPKFIHIKTVFKDDEDQVVFDVNDEKQLHFGRLIEDKNHIYLVKKSPITAFLKSMPSGIISMSTKFENRIFSEVLFPLSQKLGIKLPENMGIYLKSYPMTPTIQLKEFNNSNLIVEPIFYYDSFRFDLLNKSVSFVDDDGKKILIERNFDEEKNFVAYIKSLHAHFNQQNFQPYFTLPFDLVMKNNWFIQFTREIMSKGVKILGFNELKKFKYNTNKPSWDMKISSGIDWFDVKIKVSWGDQEVNLRDIRKAILNNQDFIVLDDGSIGVLPEEWIVKYSKLFKFSSEEKDGVKIYKKQFNIVELLFSEISEQDIIAEINEKKQKLLHVEDIITAPVPKTIKATLRPYQETGYQWMQVLDEISWGGCLADDMGLGKTLQTITFLAYIKQKYNNPTSLIVCPTSLIYNWESELNKFCPDLSYYLYYGNDRSIDTDALQKFDIVITSYGVIRNDLEKLNKCSWEYVILDESQAIKNPEALSTKAVQLLKTRNKFILSGTPLQNNTYDIYAQFNFLNPGMMGNKDFFKQEFANPIDKNGDPDAGIMLRNLIKPFILRRTKSEVAVDLPEKTETILWCQMESRQKQLYDEYKEYYRQSILQKIESDGIAKSSLYILEGLLRLRQICDDPRLVNDEQHQAHKGTKIRELMREIEENTGEHKMLIFSQFTSMLALIRQELDQNSIKYCYLDGSTPAHERKDQVETFQNNDDIKIFLISLKAGGVGLNLTEADYVYLVDPWWNPAVEQQAIDRTHRIGQKNNIFAYKMICKDSVEEKIIKLQEKKLALSKEIVQNDNAFLKKLSKEDVQYLFS